MAKQTEPERLGHHLELFQTTFHEFFFEKECVAIYMACDSLHTWIIH